MKYYIATVCIVITLFLGMYFDFPLWIHIGLNLFLFTTLLIWELTVFVHNFKGDFTLKSYRKSLSLTKYLGTIPIIFPFLFEKKYLSDGSTIEISLVLLVIALVSVDVITYITYKLKHPITIFIANDTLIFNNLWQKRRDLKNLNYIGIPRMSGELELGFIEKKDIRIPFREYNKKEFREFLEILVEKSEHNVYLTEKVQKKFPVTLLEQVV